MGASGSVSYLFDNKGVMRISGDDADAIFELLLEADVDVDDVEAEEGTITVTQLQLTFTRLSLLCVSLVSKNSSNRT